MLYKPDSNHNWSRSEPISYSLPLTIAGRNPSFLGSTCLIAAREMLLVLIGLHISVRVVRYHTQRKKSWPQRSNLK